MPRFINSTHATRPARYSAPEWGEEYQALPRYSVPVTASIRVNPTRSANAYVPRQSTFPRPERAIQYQAVPRTAASIALRRAIEHREQSPATVTINPAGLSRASRGGLPPSDPTRLTTSAPAATRINPALFAQTYAPQPPTFLNAPPRATAPHEPSRTPVFMNVREAIAPPVATAASPRTTATIGRRWAIERREQSPATVTINPAGLSQANRGLPPSDRRRLTTSAPAATRINPGLLAQTYVPRPPTFLTVPPRATAPHKPSRTLVFMNVREAIAPPVATAIRPRITDRWAAENQLETRHAIEQCIRGRAANDHKMLTIMRGVFRQEQLYAFAERKVAQQQAARLTSDPVETRLFYTLALKERLQLPGKTQHI